MMETCRTPGLLVRANLSWCPLRWLDFYSVIFYRYYIIILWTFFFFTYGYYKYVVDLIYQRYFFFYYPNYHLTTGWPPAYCIRTHYIQIKSRDNSKKTQTFRNEMCYLTVIRVYVYAYTAIVSGQVRELIKSNLFEK